MQTFLVIFGVFLLILGIYKIFRPTGAVASLVTSKALGWSTQGACVYLIFRKIIEPVVAISLGIGLIIGGCANLNKKSSTLKSKNVPALVKTVKNVEKVEKTFSKSHCGRTKYPLDGVKNWEKYSCKSKKEVGDGWSKCFSWSEYTGKIENGCPGSKRCCGWI
jgi:hypothetical protein